LLSEFAPIAAGRPGIHLLDQVVRGDAHFVSDGRAEADPPTLAFLVEAVMNSPCYELKLHWTYSRDVMATIPRQ
jgi:hypothetical protein